MLLAYLIIENYCTVLDFRPQHTLLPVFKNRMMTPVAASLILLICAGIARRKDCAVPTGSSANIQVKFDIGQQLNPVTKRAIIGITIFN